jgi:hypothetical protein
MAIYEMGSAAATVEFVDWREKVPTSPKGHRRRFRKIKLIYAKDLKPEKLTRVKVPQTYGEP